MYLKVAFQRHSNGLCFLGRFELPVRWFWCFENAAGPGKCRTRPKAAGKWKKHVPKPTKPPKLTASIRCFEDRYPVLGSNLRVHVSLVASAHVCIHLGMSQPAMHLLFVMKYSYEVKTLVSPFPKQTHLLTFFAKKIYMCFSFVRLQQNNKSIVNLACSPQQPPVPLAQTTGYSLLLLGWAWLPALSDRRKPTAYLIRSMLAIVQQLHVVWTDVTEIPM